MGFKISSWAIRHPIPIIVLFLLVTVLGIRAFQGLPINADPDMRFPMVNITVTQTGTSADELENTVTRRVEDAVAGMAGVRHYFDHYRRFIGHDCGISFGNGYGSSGK